MINHNKIDLKKEVEELKKMKGKERGTDYKYLVNYILEKRGQAGLNKIKKELNKINFKLPNSKK